MATLATLRSQTRRLIGEASASAGAFFGSDESLIDQHLQTAYAIACGRIQEIRPEEFLRRATANIAVGTDGTRARYERPLSGRAICRSYEIMPTTGGQYRQMAPLLREQALVLSGDVISYTDGTVRASFAYYIEGTEIVIVPEPAEDVTAGLRATFYEIPALTAVGDEPRMPDELHHLLAYGAAILALEETKDAAASAVDRLRARWGARFGDFEASTPQSREALKAVYRRHEPMTLVGMRLG